MVKKEDEKEEREDKTNALFLKKQTPNQQQTISRTTGK